MINVHHKPIKKFNLDGKIHSDSVIGRLRLEYAKLLKTEMKLLGYVPRIDIDEDFTISYNEKKQYFEFELSIYGIFVGKKQSEWIMGVDGTSVVPIRNNKSAESLREVA
jgi:hypothetical protein